MIDVVCVLWGKKYTEDYVHILKSSVERNTTKDHRFICFSDKNIDNVITYTLKGQYEGWWNKLQLFDKRSFDLNERVVYFDLDIVITDNIDWLFDYSGNMMGNENNGVANHKYEDVKQYENKFMSATMAWNSTACQPIWDYFSSNEMNVVNSFRGDGEFLDALLPTNQRDLIQRVYPGKFKSYKYECYEDCTEDKPKGTSIIDFHGEPNPYQAIYQTVYPWGVKYEPREWVKKYWRV